MGHFRELFLSINRYPFKVAGIMVRPSADTKSARVRACGYSLHLFSVRRSFGLHFKDTKYYIIIISFTL